jgi:benzodiazapine receptor
MDQRPDRISSAAQAVGLVVALVVVFTAAALGNWATLSSVNDWYRTLNRPAWTPPDWVFGPVWTALYAIMAVAAWLVWRKTGLWRARWPLAFFLAQLVLNTLWSVVFFGLRQPAWAFAEIVVFWLAIAVTTVAFWQRSRIAGALMVPYLAWVTFAAVLNFEFARLNA